MGCGSAIFLLSFFGFAVKAGLVPVNSWLPLAHPVAPTNISALLSAVIVNLGIYGIVRVNLDLAPTIGAAPGIVVLVIGSLSALIGILYATIQGEMKRLLAHSTIENMGIVTAGIGAAMVFVATGHQVVGAIALIAAFYHLANHSVYKALLFLGTGAVEAGTGTRDLDLLGGIVRRMPWTSAFFLVGVLSIAAMPPFNGFVSEWLTLQTVLRSAELASTPIKIVFAVCGALLALTAGLAVTCFVKVFAMGFLGLSRSPGAAAATEAGPGTRTPLAILAALCIVLGILPTYVIPAIDRAVAPLAHASATAALVPPFFSADRTAKRRQFRRHFWPNSTISAPRSAAAFCLGAASSCCTGARSVIPSCSRCRRPTWRSRSPASLSWCSSLSACSRDPARSFAPPPGTADCAIFRRG